MRRIRPPFVSNRLSLFVSRDTSTLYLTGIHDIGISRLRRARGFDGMGEEGEEGGECAEEKYINLARDKNCNVGKRQLDVGDAGESGAVDTIIRLPANARAFIVFTGKCFLLYRTNA